MIITEKLKQALSGTESGVREGSPVGIGEVREDLWWEALLVEVEHVCKLRNVMDAQR